MIGMRRIQARLGRLPKLVRFVLKWNAVGIAIGWVILAMLLWQDVSGIGGMAAHSPSGWLAIVVLMLSFAVTAGPVAVTVAVLLAREFGDGPPANHRLQRWKSGKSAAVERDAPLP